MTSWTKDLRGTDAPKQYRQGYVEFYKLKLKVDERVLIPRPETELIVDQVINFVNRQSDIVNRKNPITDNRYTILDIGTGSGCIAISLAKNLPKAHIFATDISDEALEVARENAKKHHVEKRIFFLKSDLLSVMASPMLYRMKQSNSDSNPSKIATSPTAPRNDNLIIVANLPYIPSSNIPYLARSVKDFEPWLALDGGSDGFDLYRKLFQQIKEKFPSSVIPNEVRNLKIKPRDLSVTPRDDNTLKLIVCEIDESQDGFDHIARNEAKKYFPEAEVEIKLDLAKKPRILLIRS